MLADRNSFDPDWRIQTERCLLCVREREVHPYADLRRLYVA